MPFPAHQQVELEVKAQAAFPPSQSVQLHEEQDGGSRLEVDPVRIRGHHPLQSASTSACYSLTACPFERRCVAFDLLTRVGSAPITIDNVRSTTSSQANGLIEGNCRASLAQPFIVS